VKIEQSEELQKLKKSIFSIGTEKEFKSAAIALFKLQFKHNSVYRKYCKLLGKGEKEVKQLKDIPFLPIQFFKHQEVKTGDFTAELVFKSSGTGGARSVHHVKEKRLYEQSFLQNFSFLYGPLQDLTILALLPSYLEQGESSLIYMCDRLIQATKSPESGFYLHNYSELVSQMAALADQNRRVLLIGVSYALLDLVEQHQLPRHPKLRVMETGGMKGRRKELIREELHHKLSEGFGQDHIHSEYGMTELLSQAYSKGHGIFQCPPWMKVLIRNQEDPFSYVNDGQYGGINVIDLANIDSCAFIQTDDLGRGKKEKFEVLGRFDNSELRGCNLLIA